MPNLFPLLLEGYTPVLTERRKVDRIRMARHVAAVALHHGAQAEIVDKPYGDLSPQEIVVRIRTPRGLLLSVDFDGKSCQPDVHVLSWHMDIDSDARLADAFCPGHVNPFHRRKATDVAYGLRDLCETLAKRLTMVEDGSAFMPAEA